MSIIEHITYIASRLKNKAVGGHVAGAEDIIDDTLGKTQDQLNAEFKAITDQMVVSIQGNDVQLTGDPDDIVAGSGKVPTANAVAGKINEELTFSTGERISQTGIDDAVNEDSENLVRGKGVFDAVAAEEARAKVAEQQNADDIDVIKGKIPAQASSSNQLADKQFVNSTVATETATYRGCYNLVSDLGLAIDATEAQTATALAAKMASMTPPVVPDNNDYTYVMIPTAVATPSLILRVDRYKYNGTEWLLEYPLNNSGFTAAQWAAINSGITSGLVGKLGDLPTAAELAAALLAKQDVIDDLNTIRSGASAGATAVQPADIAGMESTTNKVASLSAQSTDTQYPSAKCVYDMIGNIETLLAAI